MDKITHPSRFTKKEPCLTEDIPDPLYGHITFSGVIQKLIDLEVFQRLRGIKHLGTLYLGFPGAFHTRFEHSVGVSYLAQHVHERLRVYLEASKDQEIKKIELNEVTYHVIEIIALLHDIGHGPFAHVFEKFCECKYRNWTHEQCGEKLITGKDEAGNLINHAGFQQIPTYLVSIFKC